MEQLQREGPWLKSLKRRLEGAHLDFETLRGELIAYGNRCPKSLESLTEEEAAFCCGWLQAGLKKS